MMYQQTSSSSTDLPYSNGHLSPPSTKPATNGAVTPQSESDLSEALDTPNVPSTLPNSEQNDGLKNGEVRASDDESLQDEDALGSDDPDYDMATPPTGNAGSPSEDRSRSQDSPRQRKRKADPEHEDYMLNNPELYGLRRSVSQRLAEVRHSAKRYIQGRPRPSRQIVCCPPSIRHSITH